VEEDLKTRLRATAAITALVGTVNSRAAIDWIERPEVLPALTMQDITAGRLYAHDGAAGLKNPVIQFDCWGTTYLAAKLLARAVIAEMETAETVGTTKFDNSFLVASRAMDPEYLGSGIKVFRQSLDFSVWHSPA
jgi:hypothetical protein